MFVLTCNRGNAYDAGEVDQNGNEENASKGSFVNWLLFLENISPHGQYFVCIALHHFA